MEDESGEDGEVDREGGDYSKYKEDGMDNKRERREIRVKIGCIGG